MIIFPRTLWTRYRTDDGKQWICIWRQWLNFTWSALHVQVAEANFF